LAGTSAALALLDDVHRHRLRRAALHLPPPGQERAPFYYSDGLLAESGNAMYIIDRLSLFALRSAAHAYCDQTRHLHSD
jgi:hypothetical protein